MMKVRLRLFMLTLTAVLTVAMALAGVAAATKPDKPEKALKPFSATGEIRGTVSGQLGGKERILIELFRREDQQLISAGKTETKGNGDFAFSDLKPGEYVLTPDLATLPEGTGLIQRHTFVVVHQQIERVEFLLDHIQKLTVADGAQEITVDTGDNLAVETAAFNAQGQYLFARSEIELPPGLVTKNKYVNGAEVKLGEAKGPFVVKARNGSASVTVTVKGQ